MCIGRHFHAAFCFSPFLCLRQLHLQPIQKIRHFESTCRMLVRKDDPLCERDDTVFESFYKES